MDESLDDDFRDEEVDFRTIPAWQKAMALVQEIYRITEGKPVEEGASVAAQLRGVSVTVPSKIAGGVGSGDPTLLAQNLSLAYSALMELKTLFYVAHDMNELEEVHVERLMEQAKEVGKLIYAMADNLPASHPIQNGHGALDIPPFDE